MILKSKIIGIIVTNMANLEEAVFGGNTTLWKVLDTQGITSLTEDLRRLEQQLVSLGTTVDRYKSDTNAALVALNSRTTVVEEDVITLNADVGVLKTLTTAQNVNITALDTRVTANERYIIENAAAIAVLNLRYGELNRAVAANATNIAAVRAKVENVEEDLPRANWVKYNTDYHVTEWPFWQTGFQSYVMRITGSGDYVPMNRVVNVRVNNVNQTVTWGIPFRDIPPNAPNGDPSPLMQGLVSSRWNQTTTAVLCYIYERQ